MQRSKIGYQGWLIAMHRVLTNATGKGRSQAGPRTGDYAEVGVASGLPDSYRVGREARGGLSGGVVKTASITRSSDAGMDGGTWGRWSRFLCAAVRVDDLDIAMS